MIMMNFVYHFYIKVVSLCTISILKNVEVVLARPWMSAEEIGISRDIRLQWSIHINGSRKWAPEIIMSYYPYKRGT